MATTSPIYEKVHAALAALPDQGIEELSQYLDFLAYKYQTEAAVKVVALGGLWEQIPLDVTDEDVRELRQKATNPLLNRIKK
jgi:hypothetical protein